MSQKREKTGYDRVGERRNKVITNKVACRMFERHSTLRKVKRLRELAKRELEKNSQLGKGREKTVKNISNHQSPSYAASTAALLASVFG